MARLVGSATARYTSTRPAKGKCSLACQAIICKHMLACQLPPGATGEQPSMAIRSAWGVNRRPSRTVAAQLTRDRPGELGSGAARPRRRRPPRRLPAGPPRQPGPSGHRAPDRLTVPLADVYPSSRYLWRSAAIGSMRDARCAGTKRSWPRLAQPPRRHEICQRQIATVAAAVHNSGGDRTRGRHG